MKPKLWVGLGVSAFALLMSATSAANQNDRDELLEHLAGVETLSASFVQDVVDANGEPVQRMQGSMSLKRPQFLRWQTDAPDETLLVANGEAVYYYNPFVEQVTIYSQAEAVSQSPMLLLFDADHEGWNNYDVTQVESTNGDRYRLAPKDDTSVAQTIELVFDDELIQQLVLDDGQGQVTTIALNEQEVNQAISNATFEFEVPEGIAIDDQRGDN